MSQGQNWDNMHYIFDYFSIMFMCCLCRDTLASAFIWLHHLAWWAESKLGGKALNPSVSQVIPCKMVIKSFFAELLEIILKL